MSATPTDGSPQTEPKLFGILVTFERPEPLGRILGKLREQDRHIDRLVVVDNSASDESRDVVTHHSDLGHDVVYIPASENMGPAGGIALGMNYLLPSVDDHDWIVLVDDNDPPHIPTLLSELFEFAQVMINADASTGAVGFLGGRFDLRSARMHRLEDWEIEDVIAVDSIGGGHFPIIRVGAIRHVGPFSGCLFFGYEELEFGLRLRRAGYSLYACGRLWRESRATNPLSRATPRPATGLGELNWRRYYSLRNLVYILLNQDHVGTAVRVTLVSGILKPVLNLPVSPGAAWRHLSLNVRACRDAWLGNMGRTIEPGVIPQRAKTSVSWLKRRRSPT